MNHSPHQIIPLLFVLIELLCFQKDISAQGPAQYTITDLGAFTARTMNNSDQVVGSMGNKAVLYSEGVLKDISPPSGSSAEAFGINNRGQAVGRVSICDLVAGSCVNSRGRAFIYSNGTIEVLGTLGGRDSQAFSINDSGQVTGSSSTSGSAPQISGPDHAFIFKDGVFDDIGAKMGTTSSFAEGINASGQIVGFASLPASSSGAFFYNNGSALFFESRGVAHDVNDQGLVVGHFGGNDDGSGRAFLFSGGVRQDLGTLSSGHTFSFASAINNAGQIVGVSSPSFFYQDGRRAFIYSDGSMRDLNNAIAVGSGWVLEGATDINDAGQIVGNGLLNGQPHAFLLTPTQPLLLTESNTNRVIALESVNLLRDPFSLTNLHNFSADHRTRITLFARNMETTSGESVAPPTVLAEDAQNRVFALPVEFTGKVPNSSWITQIVVRLPDELAGGGDLQISVSFRGNTSSKAVLTLKL